MRRGEIYYIEDSNNTVGCEQRGTRPALVIGNDIGNKHAPVLIVVFFTTQHKKTLPTHVYVRGHGTALCEQICTIDKTRVLAKKGECTKSDMERINKALLCSLGMEDIWQNGKDTNTPRYSKETR